jgi:hypothetical protein
MRIFGIIASSVQKAFTIFSDNFNRTTSGELGTSSSGGLWKALRGVWFAEGTAAQSTDAANTYPISFIDMSAESTTASVVTGDWAVISTGGTVGTISSNTVGGATFFTATVTGMSSTTGMAIGQRIRATNGTGSLYGGTPDFIEITAVNSSTSITYRTKGGTTPTAGTVSNIETSGSDGGAGIAIWITDSGNWWGVSYGRGIDTSCNCSTCTQSACSSWSFSVSYNCIAYQNYSSTNCNTWNFQSSDSCQTWQNYTITNYNCIYWTTSTSCNTYSIGSGYKCIFWQSGPTGFSGNVCVEYSPNYTCSTWKNTNTCGSEYWSSSVGNFCQNWTRSWTYQCTNTVTSWSPACSSTSSSYGYNCTGTTWSYVTCNCQTCYPPYIRVIQSASNAVTEITRWTLSSMAAAFKVITNSATKVITVRPYKDIAMTTQIGSDLTYTASSATISKKFGIVLSPSDNIQGSKLDDFNIQSN